MTDTPDTTSDQGKCPKCGDAMLQKNAGEILGVPYDSFNCRSIASATGVIQSHRCRARELEQQVARLTRELEESKQSKVDYRDCLDLASDIAGAVQCYGGDDLIEQIIPSIKPLIGALLARESENAHLHAMLLESYTTPDAWTGVGNLWTPESIAAELARRAELERREAGR